MLKIQYIILFTKAFKIYNNLLYLVLRNMEGGLSVLRDLSFSGVGVILCLYFVLPTDPLLDDGRST